jgi:hypothetical protein
MLEDDVVGGEGGREKEYNTENECARGCELVSKAK